MKRVDICAADDFAAVGRLVAAIWSVGGEVDGGDGGGLGVGLHRFPTPAGELTVFVDAWAVDLAGPAALVDEVLAVLAAAD